MGESIGRFRWWEGLKGRFILVIVLVIIAQGVLIGLYAGYQSKKSLEAELVKRGKSLARMHASRKIGFLQAKADVVAQPRGGFRILGVVGRCNRRRQTRSPSGFTSFPV